MIFKWEHKNLYVVVLIGNLLGLTGDISDTWSSPMIPKFQSNNSEINPLQYPINANEESWIGSLNSIGAIIGLITLTFLSDFIGRKPTLLIISIPAFVGYFMYGFGHKIDVFYAGRILSGISVAAGYIVFPIYVAEISEDSNRGLFMVSYTVFASFGSLLPYFLGPYLSIKAFNLGIAILPLTFFVLFMFFAPESPYYLVKKNQTEKARSVLQNFRGKDYNCDKEIEDIQSEIKLSNEESMWETMCKRHSIKGTVITILLNSFQQTSGFGAVVSYTEIIFREAHSNISDKVAAMLVGLVYFFASFTCPIFVDRYGRKVLLIISLAGCAILELIFGFYYHFRDNGYNVSSFSWIPLFCLMSFMLSYNLGLGPLAFAIPSEILPVNIKFLICAMGAGVGWGVTFLTAKFYGDLNVLIGKAGTMWVFSGFCFLGIAFIIFCVPETKGKSFKQIQDELSQ